MRYPSFRPAPVLRLPTRPGTRSSLLPAGYRPDAAAAYRWRCAVSYRAPAARRGRGESRNAPERLAPEPSLAAAMLPTAVGRSGRRSSVPRSGSRGAPGSPCARPGSATAGRQQNKADPREQRDHGHQDQPHVVVQGQPADEDVLRRDLPTGGRLQDVGRHIGLGPLYSLWDCPCCRRCTESGRGLRHPGTSGAPRAVRQRRHSAPPSRGRPDGHGRRPPDALRRIPGPGERTRPRTAGLRKRRQGSPVRSAGRSRPRRQAPTWSQASAERRDTKSARSAGV